ncbi:NUDIX hydrolase [Paenibacillus sp. L3-i20]|uniref:NUDIX hydrolase n=1 Tax=Paenibacillus sp. L3-i20 TaxID=2905833 RepID=UPI001EDDECD3|nr:NUDIX hydrolase [Paenibacillus sp. L3-i20]GKU79624.1 ADP-ribose pyrophosphatase [Paenibacillus sp. L3-i20]
MGELPKPEIWQEDTIHTESIYEGKVISLQVDTVKLANGLTVNREIVKHPQVAAIIALVNGKLLVVDQYRKAIEKSQIEIPAGKLEEDEDPLIAAGRELEEETGYRAKKLKLVNSFYTASGFSNQKLFLYFTDELEQGKQSFDEDEDLQVEAITVEQADAYIATGRISDAKTIMAIYVWKLYLLKDKL